LETIYYIDAEGEEVRASRLAEWLGVAQPTVAATLQRMVRDGLVAISVAKAVSLTPRGREAAASVVRRHRVAERWLTDVLGLDWLQADEEAGRLEHALSDDVAERLFRHIGEPRTCPHGNPIPGVPPDGKGERRLRDLPPGQVSRVRRVSEVSEHETPELLRFLTSSGLGLGAEVRCQEINKGGGTQTVRVGRREVAMALEVAGKIWVE
ncbi:MAG TPA: metal-dependent transcriptional regulator, partial [Candidatus Dormibacteraeota bacterium]|nr:metal-dependent transcriptional regulator [Candidatus Dormibacteraeota bacterium]